MGCTQTQETFCPTSVSPVPAPVEEQIIYYDGGPTPLPPITQGGGTYRCIFHRLGCDLAGSNGPGHMVPTAKQGVHQCPGVTGCIPGSPVFPSKLARQACAGEIGQHNCRLSHQSPRRDQVTETFEIDSAAPDQGGATLYQPLGTTEHACRFSEATFRGVEVSP